MLSVAFSILRESMNNQPPRIPPLQPAPPIIPPRKPPGSRTGKVLLFLVFAFCGFMCFRLVQFAQYLHAHPRHRSAGEAAFREANRLIITGHEQTAFGNTPEAIALAESFSGKFKSLREEFFTKGNSDKDLFASLTKGEFPTYCQ